MILRSFAVFVLTLTLIVQNAPAATQSTAVTVNAGIQTTLSMSIVLSRVNPITNTEVPGEAALNFGQLKQNTFGGMDAANYFKAYISVNSQAQPYTVTQNGTSVSNGAVSFPANACKAVPFYNPGDNGGAGLVGTLGSEGTWVGTRTLYTSNSAGALRTISVVYALVGDPAAGAGNFIPINQPAGNYTGTVTFTVTV